MLFTLSSSTSTPKSALLVYFIPPPMIKPEPSIKPGKHKIPYITSHKTPTP